ncbi:MAG: CBS domain-containing protein [Bacteroidetes bacterium]|nr:CBS domain-containing protein [Bacteroidota bacterium]
MSLNLNIPISEIMSEKLITVNQAESISKIAEVFRKHTIHHIPVVENGKLIGIISKMDFMKISQGLSLSNKNTQGKEDEDQFKSLQAEDVMTRQVVKLSPEDKISYAVDIFRENLFHALPIVDNKAQLVGILTTYDLLNYAFRAPSIDSIEGEAYLDTI